MVYEKQIFYSTGLNFLSKAFVQCEKIMKLFFKFSIPYTLSIWFATDRKIMHERVKMLNKIVLSIVEMSIVEFEFPRSLRFSYKQEVLLQDVLPEVFKRRIIVQLLGFDKALVYFSRRK